jgi:thiosulfate/3-mercaptopyruvate sulfurtransferase
MHTTLISAARLALHLSDPRWRIFDVRHDLFDAAAGRRAYDAGHIPGARFAHIDTDLSGAKTGTNGRHPLPDREAFAAQLRAWGVSDDTQVVAYDAHGGQFAARLWWLVRWLGHEAVAVLDGGWPAWLAAGGATQTAAPAKTAAGDVTPRAPRVALRNVAEVQGALGDGSQVLVDARLPERYRGEQEPIDPVAGHIPGALNRPWTHNLDAAQQFKPADTLRGEFAALMGGRSPQAVTLQCGSGVTACHHALAMEVAGLPGAALYAGSWSEWIADRSRPVATGSAP